MNILKKLFDVLVNNMGYTIVLVITVTLFAVFSNGLLAGLITALSALLAYICIAKLYKEFTKKTVSKK